MKKRYILIAIILFLTIVGKASAAVGDLIYEITNLNINDTENGIKITFEGWAFIHLTNNFKGDFREGKSNYIGEPSYDGGQEIMIIAEDQNGNKYYSENTLYDEEYKGINAEKLKKYNFYYMQFYDKYNANVEKEYYTNYNHLTGNYDSNTCKMYGGHNSQCIYEDIGFHIEFNIENLSSDTTYKFYLYATNTDYNEKYNKDPNKASGTPTTDLQGKVANLKNDSKNWCGSEIYFYENVLKNNTTGKVEIIGKSYSKDQVYVTVQSGMPRLCSGSINTCGVVGGGPRNYIENTTYNLYGEKRIERTECLEYNCGPGDYVINTNSSGLHPGTDKYTRIYRSWALPAGSTTLTIKVKSDKKCEVSEPTHDKEMKCNNWTNLSSTCKELTVRNGNSSATVKIVQNGYISNIFKSNLVNNDKDYDASSYDGGWFKYGIIYYNEVSWESPNLSQDNEKKIEEAMKYRLKTMEIFTENLNLTINGLNGSRLIKKCNQSGEFKNGEKIVTVCTFFLPDIDAISSTGKVSYKESDDNDNINNKYYIPFNENENEHSVSVILKGLSRLSENQAAKDSKEQNKEWFGTWEIDTGCNLKVVNRLYNPPGGGDGKLKYKFIYRPIDLSNPFPNRFPGVNWYSWYIIEKNKDKKTLEDSYKKLEYSAELNNATISKIKNYNKENTYFGEVDEDFFKTYIIKEGGNS